MYIVPIAWLYVAVLMSAAEATSSNGTVLGALITFFLYGLLPVALVVYIMATPARKRALREKAAHDTALAMHMATLDGQDQHPGTPSIETPDAGGHTPTDTVPPVRKEA